MNVFTIGAKGVFMIIIVISAVWVISVVWHLIRIIFGGRSQNIIIIGNGNTIIQGARKK